MNEFFQSPGHSPYFGEILSAGSAFVWAISVLIFRVSGKTVQPLSLNFFKSVLSTLLLILTMLLLGQPLLPRASAQSYGLLVLSGAVGIAVSDTLFFACLNLLGAGLTAIVDCLYSVFVILFALLFIGERMSLRQLLGVALIVSAILLVSSKREEGMPPRKSLVLGIGLGTLSMITLAGGIVMIKPLLATAPLLWATFVRMGTGAILVGGLLVFHPKRRSLLSPLAKISNWRSMVPGTFLGAYVGLVAWMAGMKWTQASVAAPLNQLNSIFIFIMAAVFLGEKVPRAKMMAVGLATVGAVLVSWP